MRATPSNLFQKTAGCFLGILLLSCSLIGSSMAASLGDLNEFKSVEPTEGGLKLTFRDQGLRLIYKINGYPRKVSAYGESVFLKYGQHAEFGTRHSVMKLTPLDGTPPSFKVEKEQDARSMGGSVSAESFTLSVDSGTLVFGPKTSTPGGVYLR